MLQRVVEVAIGASIFALIREGFITALPLISSLEVEQGDMICFVPSTSPVWLVGERYQYSVVNSVEALYTRCNPAIAIDYVRVEFTLLSSISDIVIL